MAYFRKLLITAVLAGPILATGNLQASEKHGKAFEVTITNITQGVIFTPVMVASHKGVLKLFELGSPAGTELEILAESGNTMPLSGLLEDSGAIEVVTADEVLLPGKSVTLHVKRSGNKTHVSVASMIVPSNDAFIAVNDMAGPRGSRTLTVYSPAYDAGSEDNDELCVSIPGPPHICAGEGYTAGGGEGFVHIHPGTQGTGDLIAAEHDWRNPVAKISIRTVKY